MTMTRKTITISDAMDEWVKPQIGTGRYGNDSEYFRDLIRHDQERQEKLTNLRAAIEVGRNSGVSDRTMDEILQSLTLEANSEV